MSSAKKWLLGCALSLSAFSPNLSSAGPINVDGYITDWGSTGVFTNTTWKNGLSGPVAGFDTHATFTEDPHDTNTDDASLGPNRGGQNYDAEFLGVGTANHVLYIVIVSGQRRDNTVPGATTIADMVKRFSPGDIRIETTDGTIYGIEVGGGAGGTGSAPVNGGDAGTTYNIASSGFTDTTTPLLSHPATYTAGSLVKNATWKLDPILSAGLSGPPGYFGKEPVQQLTGGSKKGNAIDYIFNLDTSLGEHSVIELALSFSLFEGRTIKRIQWAPSCGNDFVYLDNLGIETPEPATFLMGLLGIASIGGLRRFRREVA